MHQTILTQTADINTSIQHVVGLHRHMNHLQTKVLDDYGNQIDLDDVRYLYFWTLQESTLMYLQHLRLCIKAPLNNELIDAVIQDLGGRISPDIEESYYKSSINSYFNWVKNNLFVSFFVDWENCIRLTLSVLNGCPPKSNLLQLIKDLLQNIGLGNSPYNDLIGIILYTRNTMHNGGFHNKPSCTIPYKDKTYDFTENQAIDFATEDDIIFWITEISNMMYEIFNNSALRSIPKIVHNHTSVQFVAPADSEN